MTVCGRMRITAAEGVRAAVLADGGLTVASEWMFAPELESGAVRLIGAKARAFVTFVEKTLASPPRAYDWPGNAREFQNLIERSVILTTGPELQASIVELVTHQLENRSCDDAR